MKHRAPLLLLLVVLVGCEGSPNDPLTEPAHQALARSASATTLATLPDLSDTAQVVLSAPWGDEDGAFERELIGAQTGPMALAAAGDRGFALLDTVGGRIYRYDGTGTRRETVETAVHTADDLVLGEDDSLYLLVYRRLPAPHHEILTRDHSGSWSVTPVAQEIDLPTALWLDGTRLLLEQRHGWLHALDGSGIRRWGRPTAELELRAVLAAGTARLEARHRTGQTAWEQTILTPWPVSEILALEAGGPTIALVLRVVFDERDGGGQETWLVAFDRAGEASGRARLLDERITDCGRPYAVDGTGAILELVTDEAGLRVLRYELGGAR